MIDLTTTARPSPLQSVLPEVHPQTVFSPVLLRSDPFSPLLKFPAPRLRDLHCCFLRSPLSFADAASSDVCCFLRRLHPPISAPPSSDATFVGACCFAIASILRFQLLLPLSLDFTAKYVGWAYLKNKTGNLYNPQTNMFNLTTEEWDDFKKGHPKAAVLKTHPLPHPELCAALFDGNSATGNLKWTSTQSTQPTQPVQTISGSSSCPVQPLELMSTPFVAMDDDDGTSYPSPTAPSPTAPSPTGPSPAAPSPTGPSPTANRPQKRAKPTTPRGHSASPSTPCSSSPKTSAIDSLSNKIEQALEHLMKVPIKPKIPTIPECVEKLQVLQLEPDDPLRLAAFHVFGGVTSAREMWINLPDEPLILKGWIKMTATNLGVLKDGNIRGVKRMRDNDSAMTGHQYTLELLEQYITLYKIANMIFTFVVAGWEGIAHDSRILSEALSDPDAPFPLPPPDKYYLCDAAYAHIRGFMAPYRNVRYWLGDFRRRRALNNKEKFNHAHAKLRNVIERAYGVLKARFPILKRMAPFSLVTQRNITIACFALHNFIRKEGLSDEYFAQYEEPNVTYPNNNEPVDDAEVEVPTQGSAADRDYMTTLRDEIAEHLQMLKKQTVFLLQTADVWTTSSSAELCRCGPQTADVLALKKQTAP
ncbi:hypothetical protein LXL04_000819 [Taraxacum kok-saghyz]